MKKVVFVCLGNICRSPMAEFVMKSLTDDYEIESRATSSWEHGNPIHKGTQKILKLTRFLTIHQKHHSKFLRMILNILIMSLGWTSPIF